MKTIIISLFLLLTVFQANAQTSNCSPTFSEIYDFKVGDTFHYSIKENPGGETQEYHYSKEEYTILNKVTSGDTTIYYRQFGGIKRDTLILVNESSHFLNQCDSSYILVNPHFHYPFDNFRNIEVYALLRVYDNDTIRTYDNDYPRIVKSISNHYNLRSGFYTKSDSNTYSPFDSVGITITKEYAQGAGLLYDDHIQFESHYKKILTHKINGTDTTLYKTASITRRRENPLHISIFPNPVKDKLTLKYKDRSTVNYAIVNTMGQTIISGISKSIEHTIDLSHLPAGIYFIKGTTSESSGSVRFIKE
jgi:hypothetical protein